MSEPTDLAAAFAVVGGAAVLAATITWLLFRAVFKVWTSAFARSLWRRGRWAWRTAVACVAALAALPTTALDADLQELVSRGLVLLLIAAVTWFEIAVLASLEAAAVERYTDGAAADPAERGRFTRYVVLRRAGTAGAVVVGLATALLTFPPARAVGASLLASAGLVGLVGGVAAQHTLRNLVAGVQIAFAEPIRLDDVVVVDGEWGWIEDITLTTVVVRVWDKRRLIYPTSWFTENPFQNWTRRDTELFTTFTLALDHRADVPALRAATGAIVATSPHWDGNAWDVHTIEADRHGITVRVLMSAADGPTAWELRCDVRERLVAWLVANDPDGLPVNRLLPASNLDED